MKKGRISLKNICFLALSALLANAAFAQDFHGTWQGHVQTQRLQSPRVVTIDKNAAGRWVAKVVMDDDWGSAFEAHPISVDGRSIKLVFPDLGSTYAGKLDADGRSVTGTWSIGKQLFQLRLGRANPRSLWRETAHKTVFVTVNKNIRLEVLDWGGAGRPIVMLPALGFTAHVFSRLAAKLTTRYHVYGTTPRGIGVSGDPAIPPIPAQSITQVAPNVYDFRPFNGNPYDVNRLGDDVIEVLDTLHIERPVLVGHSIAGEELTSVASRYLSRVAGLIYLDAFAEFAFSDGYRYDALYTAQHPWRVELPPGIDPRHFLSKENVYLLGMHEYRYFPAVPALAIFAVPHEVLPGLTGAAVVAYQAGQQRAVERMLRIKPLLPTVQIVNLPNADHLVWESNEADVLREINAFIAGLH